MVTDDREIMTCICLHESSDTFDDIFLIIKQFLLNIHLRETEECMQAFG